MGAKPRIAVVSPFLDKQHGTERCVIEQLDRLADHYEIHIYSMRVENLDQNKFVWHRIPRLPGPHLLGYIGWFGANHFRRWRDRRFRKIDYDLTYSPGINCLDADVIAVHVVFAKVHERVRKELTLRRNPVRFWPQLIHRRLYYRLIEALERSVYTRDDLPLAVISRKVAADLGRFYDRRNHLCLVYNGVDLEKFQPAQRQPLRDAARRELNLTEESFAVLLVGNDWANKGLSCLLEAVARLRRPNLRVLVVGRDSRVPYEGQISRLGLDGYVSFLPLRPDVEFYYAAADAYAGPSLEDAFGLPPAEAMACGLPVIVSRQAGVSELITHDVDGLVLEDPTDATALAQLIEGLYTDAGLRRRLGENAARTAQQLTWERNAASMNALFQEAMRHGRGAR